MSIYTDFLLPYWQIYKSVFIFDLLRYAIGAGGVYLAINLALSRWKPRHNIREKTPPLRQIGRELIFSLRTVAIFAAIGSTIGIGASVGWFHIYLTVAEFGLVWLISSSLILIIAHDAWFYWAHRVMHHPRLFRRFHRVHHLSHNPTPFTAYSFDAAEAVINAVYLPLILLLIPAHPIALLVFTGHMMLRNALGHSGYEVFPADTQGRPIFGFLTTVTHHDMHHAHAGYNLGLYFTWWDKLMNTEHPDYMAQYAGKAPRLRLSPATPALLFCYGLAAAAAIAASAARQGLSFGRDGHKRRGP